MSDQITTAFVQEYKDTLELLVQQKQSRLRQAVTVKSFKGKSAKAIEQIGAVTATKLTTRHGDTPQINTPHSARWINPSDYVIADMIDEQDKLRMLVDPESSYSQNFVAAMNRAIDDELIGAATGTAYVGENGTTTEAFDTTNWDIAHGGTGLDLAKLRTAKRKLMAAENDPDEEYFLVCKAKQIDDLLGTTQVTSSDYNTVKALVAGQIDTFMGFKFVHSERILNDGTSDWVLAFPRSALCLGIWKDSVTEIERLPTRNYSTQVYNRMTIGATRTHEAGSTAKGKLVKILCN